MFAPVIPGDGLVSWRFLQRTYETQLNTFTQSSQVQRATDYFVENIGNISSAEDLVSDRRLLEVALGAFGLQDDIDNRFFIRKILEEGTTSDDALANRFSDERYKEFSETFALGPGEITPIGDPVFANSIIARFEANSFEVAAGQQNDSMRIALFAQRQLPEFAAEDMSNDAKWFSIMGQPPLRALFEKALNLPSEFGQVDIDQQLKVFKERARATFGSDDLSQFTDATAVDDLVTKYIVRSQIDQFNTNTSSASIALTLLRS